MSQSYPHPYSSAISVIRPRASKTTAPRDG